VRFGPIGKTAQNRMAPGTRLGETSEPRRQLTRGLGAGHPDQVVADGGQQLPRDDRDYAELLERLARLIPGVICQYRLFPDGRSAFPWSSPGMSLIYEVTPEEVREDATPVFGRLHPDDYDKIVADIFASARTLETFYAEFRVLLPKHGLRWRWSQAQPERMAERNGTGSSST
jgi:hypothetical protein